MANIPTDIGDVLRDLDRRIKALSSLTVSVGDGSISTLALADDSVTTDKLADGAATVAKGGTGLTSFDVHNLLVGNGASAATLLAPGTTGYPLKSKGAAADPDWGTILPAAVRIQSANTVDGFYIRQTGTIGGTPASWSAFVGPSASNSLQGTVVDADLQLTVPDGYEIFSPTGIGPRAPFQLEGTIQLSGAYGDNPMMIGFQNFLRYYSSTAGKSFTSSFTGVSAPFFVHHAATGTDGIGISYEIDEIYEHVDWWAGPTFRTEDLSSVAGGGSQLIDYDVVGFMSTTRMSGNNTVWSRYGGWTKDWTDQGGGTNTLLNHYGYRVSEFVAPVSYVAAPFLYGDDTGTVAARPKWKVDKSGATVSSVDSTVGGYGVFVNGLAAAAGIQLRYMPVDSHTTTVAAGSNGADTSTFAGSGVLTVASTSGFASSGALSVPTDLDRAARHDNQPCGPWVVIRYTAKTSTTFTGCTTVGATSGILRTGFSVAACGAAVTSGTTLGRVLFGGWYGYGTAAAAAIEGYSDGTFSSTSSPAGFRFKVSGSGATGFGTTALDLAPSGDATFAGLTVTFNHDVSVGGILNAAALNVTPGVGTFADISVASTTTSQVYTFGPTLLTGITGTGRLVGVMVSGTPGAGTFSTGDLAWTQDGELIFCTAAGTPGTWVTLTSGTGTPGLWNDNVFRIRDNVNTGRSMAFVCDAFIANGTHSIAVPDFTAGTTNTLPLLEVAQTWAGVQTFGAAGAVGKLKIAGNTSGAITVAAAAAAGTGTATLPAGTYTIAGLGLANNFSALQRFSNGISVDGSAVLTLPALTDTVATIGTDNAFSAAQTFAAGLTATGSNAVFATGTTAGLGGVVNIRHTAVPGNGAVLGLLGFSGYSAGTTGRNGVLFTATTVEAWGAAAAGTKLTIGTTAIGALSPTTAATFGSDQSAQFAGQVIIGTTATPSALLHVQQQTVGSLVMRLQSVATNDDPAEDVYQYRTTTTNNTATTAATVAIPTSTTVVIQTWTVARRTGGSSGTAEDGAFFFSTATFKNVAGTATQISTTSTNITQRSNANVTVTFTTSSGNALFQVTGDTNNNYVWHTTARVYAVST